MLVVDNNVRKGGQMIMPVERSEIYPDYWGSVEQQVLDILSDGKGYYFNELLEKITCTPIFLRTVMPRLQKKGHVRGKSRSNKKTGEWKLYFLADHLLPGKG